MLPLIVKMSLPAIFSMLIQALYNIVDSIYVAQIGQNALTAVSLVYPVQTLIIAVAVGTGVGLNSLISRRLGEKRFEEANQAADHGVILGVLSWVVFAVLGALFTVPFFRFFTQTKEVFDMGCSYMYTVTLCSFGVFVEVNLEKILQSTGNMIYPMLFQLVGAITNIILDPILIFGYFGLPKMGVFGAAVATVIGQILSMLFAIVIVLRKSHAVKINVRHFKLNKKTVGDIYKVGFPSIVMQSIMSVLTVGLNAILMTFSEAAVAVMGVYFKLQSFVFMPVFGLNQGVMPILGYNYGAQKKKRLMSALKIAAVAATGIMLLGLLLFQLFPDKLLMLFNASEEMLSYGIPALRLISINFIFAGIGIILSNLFQAVGNGVFSLIVSVLRQLVIILPVAYLLSKVIGVVGVWYAFPISEIISFVASLLLFAAIYNKKLKNLGADPAAFLDD